MSTVKIQFASKEHRSFYFDMMARSRKNDCYHRAFFYVMGIAPETRANIDRMFDFTHDWIEPEGMHGGWQTSGTVRSCHLAFNLWNGYTDEQHGRDFTPEERSAVNLLLILWRELNSVTRNTAGNFPRPGVRRSRHDNMMTGGNGNG